MYIYIYTDILKTDICCVYIYTHSTNVWQEMTCEPHHARVFVVIGNAFEIQKLGKLP